MNNNNSNSNSNNVIDVWSAAADDMVRIDLSDPDTWPENFDADALRYEAGCAGDDELLGTLDRLGL